MFEDGQACWNGPSRSLELTFLCGEKTEVVSVEEPNKCEYAAVMRIAAACPTPRKPKGDHDEL
jgi:protein kinase C substrate 80K-H